MCFRELRDEHVFVIVYAVLASYFAGVMVRLMLVLTPIVCVTAAVAVSSIFSTYLDPVEPERAIVEETVVEDEKKAIKIGGKRRTSGYIPGIYGLDTRILPIMAFTFLSVTFVLHCTWVTSTAYSSPSVVLASKNQDGSQNIIDDFREAYYWLRQNTKEDAKVMSWWDYGYQIAGFADRTTLVDNNTWNNTQ